MEIEFRAYDKEEEKMYHWNDFGDNGYGFFSDCSPVTCYGDDFPCKGDGIELMPYTGLRDKDDTKVFIGDIILGGKLQEPCEVKWDKLCGRFVAYGESYKVLGHKFKQFKVVGNIYEGIE